MDACAVCLKYDAGVTSRQLAQGLIYSQIYDGVAKQGRFLSGTSLARGTRSFATSKKCIPSQVPDPVQQTYTPVA
jgi:hypothetical protein